jgi:hypothetical protein
MNDKQLIELVEKFLADNDSVTSEVLLSAVESARDAYAADDRNGYVVFVAVEACYSAKVHFFSEYYLTRAEFWISEYHNRCNKQHN